jgi:hypothetical protein
MDDVELAALAAVECWHGSEGYYATAIQSAESLDLATLKGFLSLWG